MNGDSAIISAVPHTICKGVYDMENNTIMVTITAEDAACLRRVLMELDEVLNDKITKGTEIINFINEGIVNGIQSFDMTLDDKNKRVGIEPIDVQEIQRRVQLIRNDIDDLKKERARAARVCEAIEKILISLHIDKVETE